MRYRAKFVGRKLGTIGITYLIEDIVEADNEEAARLKLYDTYEHIHGLDLTPIKDNIIIALDKRED